jgi:hypothetical protein
VSAISGSIRSWLCPSAQYKAGSVWCTADHVATFDDGQGNFNHKIDLLEGSKEDPAKPQLLVSASKQGRRRSSNMASAVPSVPPAQADQPVEQQKQPETAVPVSEAVEAVLTVQVEAPPKNVVGHEPAKLPALAALPEKLSVPSVQPEKVPVPAAVPENVTDSAVQQPKALETVTASPPPAFVAAPRAADSSVPPSKAPAPSVPEAPVSSSVAISTKPAPTPAVPGVDSAKAPTTSLVTAPSASASTKPLAVSEVAVVLPPVTPHQTVPQPLQPAVAAAAPLAKPVVEPPSSTVAGQNGGGCCVLM